MRAGRAAHLADAVGTPFHAVIVRGALRAGERVAIFGVGGLGTHAVQIARLAGAGEIIAVDVLPAALERAKQLGADHLIDARDGDPAARSAPSPAAKASIFRSSSSGGRRASARRRRASAAAGARCWSASARADHGVADAIFSVFNHASPLLRREDVTRLVASGRLDLSGSISARIPLDQINEGVRRLESKEGNPVRIMVCPEL